MGTHVSLNPGGTTATLTVDTDIDDQTRPDLEAAAAALPASVCDLTLDLGRVRFVDSAVLHLILAVRECLGPDGGRLQVAGLGRQPSRLMGLATDLWPEARWEEYLPGAR
ncbi:STAS domain-containing protein [Streptomyces tropicalis]|uniref:STAS domain-containing protein n=1 Tax=Streptomyces tropicalis TaxID=3034234 RepID=A0ABT6A9B1_9ACTN|nr:STAS domain-containing protein [Streptomyces tropicalis]MDF3301243.1 STAS domain-containing protein [Streptomyces tropicalis]